MSLSPTAKKFLLLISLLFLSLVLERFFPTDQHISKGSPSQQATEPPASVQNSPNVSPNSEQTTRAKVNLSPQDFANSATRTEQTRNSDTDSKIPKEVFQTLGLIDQGGPFPYERDGIIFQNRENLLPKRKLGYYREYTVNTPYSRDRGARRIVTGANGERYYTDDHYSSFRKIDPPSR